MPITASFRHKVAFVSGAASGIGAAVARRLAELGAKLILVDRDEQRLDAFARTLPDDTPRLLAAADVTSLASLESAVADGVARFSQLDAAVNCAGIDLPRCPLAQYPPQHWHSVIAVNLTGVFHALRCQIPAMQAGGSIVNVASILGQRGFAGQPAYTAAKHGVIGLTKSAALDCAGQGIRINAVAPGFIDTPLLNHLDAHTKQASAQRYPMQRLGTAEEVSNVILFLLSDAAAFVTGACYTVDGGSLAQ